ncbi:MAG: SIMPL domain-containing protein [Fibrobacter sp.]|uniref:SIMPL domain-containing protein n=1 Tax=Fibrobacter sp. TaxID=35828 RepID=UPI0025C36592|nr:SIMPL domain-containing protein [Fibrobacter sp.]MBQ7080327.1 SIMPL domain-containing protein [Fibrobacter sp.]
MSRVKEALVLAVAILGLGAFLYCAMMHTKDRDRVVSVRGLSEREVKADFVIWPIVYKEVGNDLSAIYDAVQAKNATLGKFLRGNGVADSEISWSAPEIEDVQGERYGDNRRPFRYIATVVTTVASKNVDRVREIMGKQGDLLKQGIAFSGDDYRYRKIYSFNALNEIKPAMIDEANKNARAAGEKFAADSDSKLGKIKTASQGQFSISDRDENTPYIKNVRVVTSVQYFLED